MTRPGGEVVGGRRRGGLFVFRPPTKGPYTIWIEDDRILPWEASGVASGSEVDAEVVGSSSLKLNVVDPLGGHVLDYSARLRLESDELQRTHSFEVEVDLELEDGDGNAKLARGIPASEKYSLLVESEGHASTRVLLPVLSPGRMTEVVVVLGSGPRQSGHVQDCAGRVVEGAGVYLIAKPKLPNMFGRRIMLRGPSTDDMSDLGLEVARAVTDPEGRFELSGFLPGDYDVLVMESAKRMLVVNDVSVGSSDSPEDLELAFECDGVVFGRVLEIAPGCTWRLSMLNATVDTVDPYDLDLDEDGCFRIEGVSPGHWRLGSVFADNSRTYSHSVIVRAGEETRVELELE